MRPADGKHAGPYPGARSYPSRFAGSYPGLDADPATLPGIDGPPTAVGRMRDLMPGGALDRAGGPMGRGGAADRRVPDLARPYAEQVGRLDALLTELTPRRWPGEIPCYGDVPGLLAHLAANDAALLRALTPHPPGPDGALPAREGTTPDARRMAGGPASRPNGRG
ncbi:hypothetical protein, partial [Nonomuraea rhizosphaerae]|uniref:hypothetical protein n=1 Tax=Nonomuraea rhizosphaerae TaxID=2665663 RepID=UPI001C5ECB18